MVTYTEENPLYLDGILCGQPEARQLLATGPGLSYYKVLGHHIYLSKWTKRWSGCISVQIGLFIIAICFIRLIMISLGLLLVVVFQSSAGK